MNRRQRKKRVTHGKWARLVSSTFLIGERGATVTKHEMMGLGIPVARIERMFETLPMFLRGPLC